MIKEFLAHPITKEILGGPGASNISGTLRSYGNLFSFIGFYSGDRPTDEVREKLKGYLDVVGVQRKIRGNRGVSSYRYSLTFPTISSFDSVSQMPWESGNSWVRGVENGISGFSNYMYLNYGEGRLERSRSGTAVQTKKNVNVGIFRPTKYITEILDNYRKRLAQSRYNMKIK